MDYSLDELTRAYRLMKTIREFEERIRSEYQQGKLPGFIHMYRNQEAIAVGACLDMTNDDYIASTHRGHGHCIAKGCELEGMMLELACKQDGLCNGKGGSMHIADMTKGMLGANAIVGGG
ncbi:thiamine pyrophosphate-dependent enzyme, partial [Draconibacterium sp.]|nr:thiamine pyrophosphate-dependent enzyme [Draconibacterium sp.]